MHYIFQMVTKSQILTSMEDYLDQNSKRDNWREPKLCADKVTEELFKYN